MYYLKLALRYFKGQRNITLLNLFGLSLGLSIPILILYFVSFETNYDNFHNDGNRIYRIIAVEKGTHGTEIWAYTPLPLTQAVRNEIQDAEMITGITNFLNEDEPVQIGGEIFYGLKGFTADSCFLKMFNFPIIAGNQNSSFNDPSALFLTESTAKKLFGKEDPVGKTLLIKKYHFTVIGILKDLPQNSNFDFDLLISHLIQRKIHPDFDNLWWFGGSMTFIKKYPNQSLSSIQKRLTIIPGKYFPDFMKDREAFDIQPLQEIHFGNNIKGDEKPAISKSYLFILSAIAFAVLFIASANFVNLSISQSEKRAQMTACLKIFGAGKFQLMMLYIVESITLSIIALFIAVFLSLILLPWFNELSQRSVTLNLVNLKIVLSIVLIGLLTGFLSGIYPAYVFSKQQPVQLLGASTIIYQQKAGLRKVFIAIQFILTILLITSQLIITRQISFMKNHDLGFDINGLITIPIYNYDEDKRLAFAHLFVERINQKSGQYGIAGTTISENVPGLNFPNKFAIISEGSTIEDSKEMVVTSIDEKFPDVYKIPVVSGRCFSETIASDRFRNVILNETAASILNWPEPLNKRIRFRHESDFFTVVGVLRDNNFKSLQNQIEPVIYRYTGGNWLVNYITVRVENSNYGETIKYIKSIWDEIAPKTAFQYFFIKDKYLEKYSQEVRLSKIIGTFTLIAVALSCFGLFSMISFICLRRTKEIGIRKINGARIAEVMFLINKDFIITIAIAFVISCPFSLYIMQKWLLNFAYKASLSWWIFAISGLITFAIALLTASFRSYRSARVNPVNSLRYE